MTWWMGYIAGILTLPACWVFWYWMTVSEYDAALAHVSRSSESDSIAESMRRQAEVQAVSDERDEPEAPEEFPIAGKAHPVRWSVRKREIAAKHRTKRKKMEEWR